MKGYWNNEIATNDVLKEIDGNIYYKTGDQGYVKDNFLFCHISIFFKASLYSVAKLFVVNCSL